MDTNLDSLYATDTEAEKNGKWWPAGNGVEFLVKRYSDSNPAVKKALAMYYKPYARQVAQGTLSPEKEKEIMAKIFVNSSLKDWKGVKIGGQEVPFSVDEAVKLLIRLPQLLEDLTNFASDFNNFKNEEVEDLGNS